MTLHRIAPTSALLLGGSFLAVQAAQLVLLVLFEKVEYDTFSFYFSKVELMRWWTLGHYPVMSYVQEFLPIGYSKLQMLFASGNYARNGLNFIVAMAGAAYLIRQTSTLLFVLFAFFTLANTAFFMQYTGYKTDAPLAVFAVVLVHVVSRPYFRFQLSAIVALSLLILSIKWSGGIVVGVAGLLFLPTLWRLIRARPPGVAKDALAMLVIATILFRVLELGAYLDAFLKTGSFTPTENFGVAALHFSFKNLLLGLPQYMLVSIVETFEPLWRLIWRVNELGGILEFMTLGAKDHVVVSPGQIRQTINVFDAAAIIASVLVLTKWRNTADIFVRYAAIAALAYIATVLSTYPYQPFQNGRYILPGQILGYIPLAYLAAIGVQQIVRSRRIPERAAILFATLLAGAHLCVSGWMLVREHERNLITINEVNGVTTKEITQGTAPGPSWLRPIWRQNEVERAFRGWSGFATVYVAMQESMTTADPLDIVFDTRAPDTDYTYPFLRYRHPSNTTLTDIQTAGFSARLRNVLCFSASACAAVARSGAYTKVRDHGPFISFWRRN